MGIRHLLIVVLLLGAVSTAVAEGETERLHRLFTNYHGWQLRQFPEMAMRRGDYANASRITDQSLEAIERRHLQTVDFLEDLQRIERAALEAEDLVSYEIFEQVLQRDIDGHRFRTFLAPMGTRFGPQQDIPQMGDHVRFANEKDYANYIRRLGQVPGAVRSIIGRMSIGLAEGRVPPEVVMSGVPAQFEVLLAPEGLDRLAEPLDRMPAHVAPERRAELKRRFHERAMPAVRRSLEALRTFLVDTYIPGCRDSIAATELPDGEAYYAYQLRRMTTTDLTAKEIHELGLTEVSRIRAEMLQVIRRSDFLERSPESSGLDDDDLFRAFIAYLRSDPRFYHDTPEDLIAGYRAICKEIDGHMPRYFNALPRLPYGVKEVPAFMAPQQTTAYYMGGDVRNNEPGWFYANTHALDQRPKYEMIPLALHEAVPGHHHQVALAREAQDIPEFRRELWFTAYGEGWALYAERLGIDMGLYEDPYDDFGRLLYEMWRACRLVVDPGMHALGWSRQEAVDFMLENTALSELNIDNEIDRYIAWPGQATAYKIGELRIRAIRAHAEERLGARFDLATFHDVLLESGSVPLTVLERRVDHWINERRLGPLSYD